MTTEAIETADPQKVGFRDKMRDRFSDRTRWKQSLKDVGLWFIVGLVGTTAIAMYSPGYPILVGTASIPTGLYWVDTRATTVFNRGDSVSFRVNFRQDWLRKRYGDDMVHTKYVWGLAGDTVTADNMGRLTVCVPEGACREAGMPLLVDSLHRPLYPWLKPGQSYILTAKEVWVYGPHPRSLDSRYRGPIQLSEIKGKATPLWLFPIGDQS